MNDFFKRNFPKWIEYENTNKINIVDWEELPKGNGPAVILGSGPSLEEAEPYIKNWKSTIFSIPSNCFFPVYNGRIPEFIVADDCSENLGDYIRWGGWDESTKLITHPHIHPLVLKNWNGIVYGYLRYFPDQEYFTEVLPLRFPTTTTQISFRGASAITAIQLAYHMGFSPIYLVGVDFGWRNPEKIRIDRYFPDRYGEIRRKRAFTETELLRLVEHYRISVDSSGWRCWSHEKKNMQHFTEFVKSLSMEDQSKIISCSYLNGQKKQVELKEIP